MSLFNRWSRRKGRGPDRTPTTGTPLAVGVRPDLDGTLRRHRWHTADGPDGLEAAQAAAIRALRSNQ